MSDVVIGEVSRIQRELISQERIGAPMPPTGGSCATCDTGWWFPRPAQTREDMQNTKAATEICRKCPIRKDCLSYAIEWEAFGIWGGFTEKQRDSIRKSSRAKRRVVGLANSRARHPISMMVEHSDLVWLKRNGFINATS
mgnify:CR=1 FL=1